MNLILFFAGVLLDLAKPLLGRVLLALGISFVTYSGVSTGLSWAQSAIVSNLSGLPVAVVSLLSWLWVDRALSMVFSAVTASLVIKGLTGGSLTRMVTKK